MKSQGTVVGLVFKILSTLSGAMGVVTMVMALAADDKLESKVQGWVAYWQGASMLAGAVTLWWMAVVVDYLAAIAENTARQGSSTSSHTPAPPRQTTHSDHRPAPRTESSKGAATYVLD
ncbi:MAG: hypothetical protein QM755_02600 [Luteolibacter sp.]